METTFWSDQIEDPLFWVAGGVVIATSLWVGIDARLNRIPTIGDRYDLNTGALSWFIGCLILWICVFPAYWIRRFTVLRVRSEDPFSMDLENEKLREEVARLKLQVAELLAQLDHQTPQPSSETGVKAAAQEHKSNE
jgi:hypothetical protein